MWALTAQATIALAVVLVGAFSANLVLLVPGLLAYTLATFRLVLSILSRRRAAPGTTRN